MDSGWLPSLNRDRTLPNRRVPFQNMFQSRSPKLEWKAPKYTHPWTVLVWKLPIVFCVETRWLKPASRTALSTRISLAAANEMGVIFTGIKVATGRTGEAEVLPALKGSGRKHGEKAKGEELRDRPGANVFYVDSSPTILSRSRNRTPTSLQKAWK